MIFAAGISRDQRRAAARRRLQQGFTLIELSIVLTIIGLIVGGILKGQELINNARLKAQVAQIDNIKSAVFTFQDRYNGLPGDYPTPTSLGWSSNSGLGDGNGIIGTITSTQGSGSTAGAITDATSVDGSESVVAWPELVAANLLGGYTLTSPGSAITSAGLSISGAGNLASKIGAGGFLWLATFTVTPPVASGGTATTQTNLFIRLQGGTGTPTNFLKRPDMVSLDTKYDDGLPGTGSIIVGSISTADCAAGTTYSATANVTALSCEPFFGVQ